MNDENEFILSLRAQAKADLGSIDKAISDMNKKIESKKNALKQLEISAIGGKESDVYKSNLKELESYEAKRDKLISQRATKQETYNQRIIKAQQQVTKSAEREADRQAKAQEKAEEQKRRAIEQTQKAQEKAEEQVARNALKRKKDLLQQQKELEKQINSPVATKDEKKDAKKQYRVNKRDIEIADSEIKTFGSEQIKEENSLLEQKRHTQEIINNQREREAEIAERNKKIDQQAAQERIQQLNSYKQQISLIEQIGQNERKIVELGSQKGSNNVKEIQQLKQKTLERINELKAIQNSVALTDEQKDKIARAKQEQARLTQEVRETSKQMQNTGNGADSLGSKIKNIASYLGTFMIIGQIQRAMSDAVETIKDLDKAFTDIQLVTQSSNEEIHNLQQNYNELAKSMSSTTQEVAEGATEWLRQGYTLEQTNELLRSTMVLSKVGAIESSQATELLTASLNGMKMEAKDAMSIVDKVSAVDLVAATSSEELMVALSRTASSAEMAGVSFDKLLGMIGTVSSVTRKSASTIGESFKTIFARLQNVKAGVDVDEEGEALNDVETVLNKMGIRLRKSKTEWREMEDVIDEVAQKWKAYTEVEKAQIATAIAGTRQRDNFLAMMSNYKEVMDLTKVSTESAGSAEEKFAIYQDSLEAKINEVKAAWEGFLISLNQSDSLKGMMDWVIFLIENLPTAIKLIVSAAVAYKAFSVANNFKNQIESIKALNTITAALGQTTNVATVSENANTTATNTNTTAKNVNKAATIGLSTAMSALSMVIGIVSAAFSVAQMAILAYNKHMDNLKSSVEDGAQALEGIQSKMNNLDSSIESITKANEDYNNKVITLEEKNTELKSIESELVSLYGEKAKSIDLVNASYEQQLDIMDNLKQQNLQEQLAEIQKTKGAKEELLNRNVTTVMGKEDNFKGASYETRNRISQIVAKNNMTLTERTFADQISIEGKAKDQVKVYKELLAYQKELLAQGKDSEAQRVANMLDAPDFGGVWGMGKNIGMKSEYEKSGGDSLDILDDEDVVRFQIANDTKIKEYEKYLNTRNTLIEQFNNKKKEIEDLETQKNQAKTKKDKANLDLRIKNAKEASNKLYESIVENQDKSAEAYNTLMDIVGDNEELKKKVQELFSDKESDFFKVDSDSLDNLKDKIPDLYNGLKNLNNEFNKGQISTKQYFENLNNQINGLDVSKKITETENGLENLKNTIASLFGNNVSYFDTFIGDLFEDKLTDAEDVKNLQAYSTNLSSMIGMLKQANAEGGALEGQINNELFSGDGLNAQQRTEEIQNYKKEIVETGKKLTELYSKQTEIGNHKYEISGNDAGAATLPYKAKYSDSGKVENLQIQNSGKWKDLKPSDAGYGLYADAASKKGAEQYSQDVQKLEGDIKNAQEQQESFNNCIKDLETGEGLDKYMEDLGELGKVLEDMNIEDTQNAFDTLAEGINSGAIDDAISSIDRLPAKYRSAFLEVADDVVYALGSSNEQVRQQAEQSLRNLIGSEADMMLQTVDFANLSKDQMKQVATDIANKAIIAQGGVTSALQQFAQEGNAIASTAMGQAVQTLGVMLEKIGTALSQIHVTVPVKIPKIQMHVADFIGGGDLFTATEGEPVNIEIGGNNTVQGFSELGGILKNKDFADAAGKLLGDGTGGGSFNPYSFNPTGPKVDSATGGGGGGKGGKSDAEKAAEEAKKLQEKIDKFREDEGTALEDVTEELIRQYETEERKLKLQRKKLDYASELLDSEEETTKWLQVQEKLLTNQRKQIQSIYRENSKLDQQLQKIQSENKQYNISSWFNEDGEATLAYKNLLNSFAIEEKNYRKTVSLNSEEDIEAAEKHIEKIKKQRDYVENLFNSAQKLKQAWIENNEEIQDLFVEMNDNLKEMRDTLLDKFQNQLEREVTETNQAYQDQIDKLDSLITIQERYNDVINNSLDTIADLDKELRSNKDSYQYLDDYMRSIIFNEDDYKVLTDELNDIMSQADKLAEEYQTKINNLTADEMYQIEEITNQYERQVDELEKQYELRKAELDVVKAQTKLQNAQNERTVRMFVNGSWQWVADPNSIKEATEELSDAQKEADRIKREQEQLKETNKLEQEKDDNQLKIDLNEQLLEKVQQTIEDLTTEVKSVTEWLELIAKEGVPMLHDVMAGLDKVGDIGQLLGNIGSDANLMKDASKNTTEAIKQGILNGTLDPEQWAEKIGWIKGNNGKYYAPKDDPYYDPSGFDFGKANPETQTKTDESGVQVQNTGSSNTNTGAPTQNVSQFPKQGSLKNVSSILHIRSGAGMNYGIIGKIPPNGKPTVLSESGGWAQVEYNGVKGWASKDYLTYDRGGLMNGKGFALKDIIKPEAVLSPEQTKAWIKLVDNLTDPSLVHLTKTPKTESLYNPKDTNEQMIRDSYTFNNVTVQADNIEEFIASMQGYIPINNS